MVFVFSFISEKFNTIYILIVHNFKSSSLHIAIHMYIYIKVRIVFLKAITDFYLVGVWGESRKAIKIQNWHNTNFVPFS